MSQTLQNVLEEIKTLSPEELQQLYQEVGKLVQPSAQRVLLEKLKEAGILSEIKTPTHRTSTERVAVTGEPVSETIIEERR
jgi:chaperonin cofactor prefoldin